MKITNASFIKGIKGTDPILSHPIPQFAFVGRSNVGKSSLINCLLNSNSLVKSGKKPGKTQEINFFLVNNNMYFVDLPGYGFSKVRYEKREGFSKLIQWYLLEPVFKRKVILVLDARIKPSDFDIEMYRILLENHQDIIIAANKVDVLTQKECHENLKLISETFPYSPIISCSAKTKKGREEIFKEIIK
ncbi:MAG: ribosome biogenesis GTP-binding protein YihA/YsxC [Candidatus Pacebacteria bacterium]|nr:ribosome biogenesis GTP-binding protein YihA/YsxC [Candidatus Paceibacterota bacterium]